MTRYLFYVLILCGIGAAINHRGDITETFPASIRNHLPAVVKGTPSAAPQDAGGGQPPSHLIQTTNTRMPSFTLRTLDGSATVDSSMIRGQLTMVTFFAGWCGYCKHQMAIAVNMKRRYPGLRTIGIIYKDTNAKATAMLRSSGNPFDVIYVDPGGRAASAFGISGVPSNYLIDTKGAIRYHAGSAIMDNSLIDSLFLPLFQQLARESST